MSKQSEAKAAQGYTLKAGTCSSCRHFASEFSLPEWMVNQNANCAAAGEPLKWGNDYAVERNRHCGIGGFAVKKTATCARYEPKEATDAPSRSGADTARHGSNEQERESA